MKICKGGQNCGWVEDGQYHCHCYSQPNDKISRIKKVIEEVFKDAQFPISAWDKDYMQFIDALGEIAEIIEEK